MELNYRAGVGLVIINSKYQILIAKRAGNFKEPWQMPQGGIDLGETPRAAAMREMKEEIGTDDGEIIAQSNLWYTYSFPKDMHNKFLDGLKGQKQKWFLIKFNGTDNQININYLISNQEFIDWQWTTPRQVIELIVSFKKNMYRKVINEFQNYLKL